LDRPARSRRYQSSTRLDRLQARTVRSDELGRDISRDHLGARISMLVAVALFWTSLAPDL